MPYEKAKHSEWCSRAAQYERAHNVMFECFFYRYIRALSRSFSLSPRCPSTVMLGGCVFVASFYAHVRHKNASPRRFCRAALDAALVSDEQEKQQALICRARRAHAQRASQFHPRRVRHALLLGPARSSVSTRTPATAIKIRNKKRSMNSARGEELASGRKLETRI